VTHEVAFETLSREFVRAHIDALIAIGADVAGEYWREDQFLAEFPEKWRLSFAAVQGGAPVAYAVISEKAPGHAHLHHFMVRHDARGGGLGARMVAEMEARVAAHGARRLTLKVREDNADARRFYARHGFRDTRTGHPFRLLEKTLGLSTA
jgi:ribosomal protein S18 acetylase RimI-like enzyme